MRLGVWTPLPHTIRAEPGMDAAIADLRTPGAGGAVDRSFAFALDVIARGEALGAKTTLIAERFLGPDLESWILATALAGRTREIELMVAVHPGIVAPQVVAKMGASLDRVSGGRFAINIVNGWFEAEFNLFSNGAWLGDQTTRYRRMDEYIRVIKGLWTEDSFSLDGEFYKIAGATLPTKPVQLPHPTIYAASRTGMGKDIVAREGDVWFVPYEPVLAEYESNLAGVEREIRAMDARARALGRTMKYGISAHVICKPTLEAAEADAAALAAYGAKDPVSAVAAKALGAGLVGTPRRVAERIRRFEALGIETFMLHFHPMREGLETFAAEVMPLLSPSREGVAREGVA